MRPIRRFRTLAAVFAILFSAGAADAADTAGAAGAAKQWAIGFGGYSMTDFEPLTAATVTYRLPQMLLSGSFSLRTGESTTNTLFAGKVLAKMREGGSTMLGAGGTLAFLTNALGSSTATGLGFGGGLEHRLGDHVSLTAEIWPLSMTFANGGSRIGILSSGALGVLYYFR